MQQFMWDTYTIVVYQYVWHTLLLCISLCWTDFIITHQFMWDKLYCYTSVYVGQTLLLHISLCGTDFNIVHKFMWCMFSYL